MKKLICIFLLSSLGVMAQEDKCLESNFIHLFENSYIRTSQMCSSEVGFYLNVSECGLAFTSSSAVNLESFVKNIQVSSGALLEMSDIKLFPNKGYYYVTIDIDVDGFGRAGEIKSNTGEKLSDLAPIYSVSMQTIDCF